MYFLDSWRNNIISHFSAGNFLLWNLTDNLAKEKKHCRIYVMKGQTHLQYFTFCFGNFEVVLVVNRWPFLAIALFTECIIWTDECANFAHNRAFIWRYGPESGKLARKIQDGAKITLSSDCVIQDFAWISTRRSAFWDLERRKVHDNYFYVFKFYFKWQKLMTNI